MYSPSTYCASDTNVERRFLRFVYRCSRRNSSSFWCSMSRRFIPMIAEVKQEWEEMVVGSGVVRREVKRCRL